MDGSEERRRGGQGDKGREEGWKEGVVKMKQREGDQMKTAERDGGREERRHMQRIGWEEVGGGGGGKTKGVRLMKIRMGEGE